MMMESLQQYAAQFGLDLSAEKADQFAIYQRLLIEWNAKVNLTRIIEPEEIVVRHFLDSLTCATIMGNLTHKKIIDVGTGAGFPGLPLKILVPEMKLTLTDSVAKKTRFLEAVVAELGLKGVRVLADRAETLGQAPQHRQQYDWAVARAVAQLPILAEYLLPLVKVGGMVLAQKGASAERESAESHNALKILGGGKPKIKTIQLPQREYAHYLVTIPKTKHTPKKYPRNPGKPKQSPL